MPKRAIAYFSAASLFAGLIGALALARFSPTGANWTAFGVLLGLAIAAQLFPAEAPNNVIYHVTPIFIFAGVIVLPPALFVALAVIPAVVEWLTEAFYRKNREALKHWVVLPFNISLDIISGTIARACYGALTAQAFSQGPHLLMISGVIAATCFMLVNHLALGVGLVMRGRAWRETGLLDIESSLSDLVLLLLGFVIGELWKHNPWLIIPALSPLVLMYRALLVPKLKQEARSDPKTGLLNTRYFNSTLVKEIERASRDSRPLALIVCDLDYLRTINNTYGHLAGDAVVIGVGGIIGEVVGEQGLAARFGGEEFAIALSDVGYEGALALAEHIRCAVETHDFMASTHPEPIRATMSFGVACFPEDGQDMATLFHEADIATYHAKISGRNRVVAVGDLPQAVRLEGIPSEAAQPPAAPAAAEPAAVAPSRPTPAAPSRAERPAPQAAPGWQFAAFVGAVIAAGLALGAALPLVPPPLDPLPLALLLLLAVVMELIQLDFYGSGSLSVSAAIVYASALMMGLPGVMLVSAAVAVASYVARRRQGRGAPPYKLAFNWAVHSLAAAPAALMFTLFPAALSPDQPLLFVGGLTVSALVYYLLDTGLIAAVVAISQGERTTSLWREQYRWLLTHYMVLCFLGCLLTLGYAELGVPGLLGFVMPIFMMRFAQRQYVRRTEGAVQELKRLNTQLSRANRSIGQANRAIHQTNEDLLSTLAQIIDARDPSVSNHSAGVAWYATRIAVGLGMRDEEVEALRQASLLHDIGKIAIPEHILHKPARLSDDEYREVQRHAALGAELLESSGLLRHLAPLVRSHHERWDGQGYPDGLRGDAAPLGARIIAVCDTIETMATEHSYQPAFSRAEIVAELRRGSGTRFDPAVINVALALLEAEDGKAVWRASPSLALPPRRAIRAMPSSSLASLPPLSEPGEGRLCVRNRLHLMSD